MLASDIHTFFLIYLERITDQKFAVHALVTLYTHSTNIPGQTNTLQADNAKGSHVNPKHLFRKLRHGVRFATTTTATVFGNVASEIAGRRVVSFESSLISET